MSKALKALKLLVVRNPSVIAACSLTSSTSISADASPTNEVGGGNTVEFLETKYGLRIDISDSEDRKFTVSNKASGSPRTQKTPSRHYRMFPDWQTSFLWKHASNKERTNTAHDDDDDDGEDDDDDSPEVDDEVIEARYPTLWPHYEAWQQRYETAFEDQGCHLGSGAEVFPDAVERIAWDVEGLLMASWLALKEDVVAVDYLPRSKQYDLKGTSIDEELPRFLECVWEEGAFVEFE